MEPSEEIEEGHCRNTSTERGGGFISRFIKNDRTWGLINCKHVRRSLNLMDGVIAVEVGVAFNLDWKS